MASPYVDVYASNLESSNLSNVTPVNVARRVENATHMEVVEANIDVSAEHVVGRGRDEISLKRITSAYQRGGIHNLMQTSVLEAGTNFTISIEPGELSTRARSRHSIRHPNKAGQVYSRVDGET